MAVLGPVRLVRDGAPLHLPAGKTTEVLVRLALAAGTKVTTGRLIEDLWSGHAHEVAPNTLQAKVSKLRRVLGSALVQGDRAGYTLAVDPCCVDALEVLRLAASATALREAGEGEAAEHACATALGLFRGEVLPDAGDGEWPDPYRARLQEARLQLTEDHLLAQLERGAAGQLIGDLESLVLEHPLREGFWRLLITALYRVGRQADALAAYRRVQNQLRDELGLDPGPALQALEHQVLVQDVALAGSTGTRTVPRPSSTEGPVLGNVSGPAVPLIGRQLDRDRLRALVDEHPLVTIVGPAGVGKTRLAIEVARATSPPGGAWLVRLEDARTEPDVWQAVAESFHLDAATQALVLDRLGGRELVLLLDNCEQLVGMLPDLVVRMLRAAPRLHLLATTQLALGMAGEVVYPLDPLSPADSVALFAQRAAAQRRTFTLDGGAGDVVEGLCRALDGLPLAIELAAARVKVLSVEEIARRLDDRFRLLSDPSSSGPPRRRGLRGALGWSYDLLFPDDQRGLWAIACFTGGAPLAAVEVVMAALGVPPAATLDVVSRLVDRSLASTEVGPFGAVRYRLLDSIREFSLERLQEARSTDLAYAAHAAWYAEAADRARRGVRGPEQPEHVALARAERANIEQALTWTGEHAAELGLRIATGFGWTWVVLGAGAAAAARLRSAVQAATGIAAAEDRAAGLLLAGWLEASGGDINLATADLEEASTLVSGELESVVQLHLAFLDTVRGRPEAALAVLSRCQADFHRSGRDWEEGASWVLTAWCQVALGEAARATAACAEALRLLRPLRDDWGLGHVEAILGGLAQVEHRFGDAIVHLTRAAQAASRLGFAAAAAHHLASLGRAQHQQGELQSAVVTLQNAIEAAEAAGDPRTANLARVRLARIWRELGDRGRARAAVVAAATWYRAAGGGDEAAMADYLSAALDADDGAREAADRLTTVAARAHGQGTEIEVLALDTLARLRVEQGRPIDARQLLARADDLMPALGHLLADADRPDRDQARALLTDAPAG